MSGQNLCFSERENDSGSYEKLQRIKVKTCWKPPSQRAKNWSYPGRYHLKQSQGSGNPLVDAQTFADMGNIYWKTWIAEGVTPKEFRDKNMVPRPDSIEGFMLLFPFGINPEAAGDRTVHLQFNFTGEVTDSCYFTIDKGHIEPQKGRVENSTILWHHAPKAHIPSSLYSMGRPISDFDIHF